MSLTQTPRFLGNHNLNDDFQVAVFINHNFGVVYTYYGTRCLHKTHSNKRMPKYNPAQGT